MERSACLAVRHVLASLGMPGIIQENTRPADVSVLAVRSGSRAKTCLRHTHYHRLFMFKDTETQTAIEAAAFRRLLQHLRDHPEIQNIDLMITGDFCRNCLAKWLKEAAEALGLALDEPAAREFVYGEPYDQWKAKFQQEATPSQLEALKRRQAASGS